MEKKVSDFVKLSGIGKTAAYEIIKNEQYKFFLETADKAAKGVGTTFNAVYESAKKRIKDAEQ